MKTTTDIVHVIDDDPRVRELVGESLVVRGYEVLAHPSAEDFLEAGLEDRSACLVLDVVLPGLGGLDLLDRLPDPEVLPTVMISGHADVPAAVRAMKHGAIEFLEKPVPLERVVEAVDAAVARGRVARERASRIEGVRERMDRLSRAEREVLEQLAAGRTTPEIARALNRSPRTIGNHRQRILEKLEARNTAQLVAMVALVSPESGMPAVPGSPVGSHDG